MNDKEKLMEIIANARRAMWSEHIEGSSRLYKDHFFADFLLSHGVTVREPGEWKIITDDYGNEMMECSRCGSVFYDGDNDTVDCLHNFCPNCGAPMKGESNES